MAISPGSLHEVLQEIVYFAMRLLAALSARVLALRKYRFGLFRKRWHGLCYTLANPVTRRPQWEPYTNSYTMTPICGGIWNWPAFLYGLIKPRRKLLYGRSMKPLPTGPSVPGRSWSFSVPTDRWLSTIAPDAIWVTRGCTCGWKSNGGNFPATGIGDWPW
jgi:hypothetical protein